MNIMLTLQTTWDADSWQYVLTVLTAATDHQTQRIRASVKKYQNKW